MMVAQRIIIKGKNVFIRKKLDLNHAQHSTHPYRLSAGNVHLWIKQIFPIQWII